MTQNQQKEEKIQDLYTKYKETDDPKIKRSCIEKLHQHIYVYPIRRFQADSELASDFYMHMYDKIERLYDEFDPSYNIRFYIFLSVKLRAHFLNFIQQKKKKDKVKFVSYDALEISPEKNLVLVDTNDLHPANEDPESLFEQLRDIILNKVLEMQEQKQTVIRLYYAFPLTIKLLRLLLQKYQSFAIFHQYRTYLKKIENWEFIQKQDNEKTIIRLSKIDEKLKDSSNQDSQDNEKLLKRKSKLLKELIHAKTPVSTQYIATFTKETFSFVYKIIIETKKNLKNNLLQYFTTLK